MRKRERGGYTYRRCWARGRARFYLGFKGIEIGYSEQYPEDAAARQREKAELSIQVQEKQASILQENNNISRLSTRAFLFCSHTPL